MIIRKHIRSINEEVSKVKRNYTEINENAALYDGGIDTNEDEADYCAAISVKAVRLG